MLLIALVCRGCAPLHQQRAQDALALGNLDQAAEQVQAALTDDPSNLQLRHLAAEIFTRRGAKSYQDNEMLAAHDDFRRAVDYEPTYAPPYDYLGLIAFSQHDWRNAIGCGDRYAGLSGEATPLYVRQAMEQERVVRAGGRALLGLSHSSHKNGGKYGGESDNN